MKNKLLLSLLSLSILSLAGCNKENEICSHIDSKHDGLCDLCGEYMEVHHIDENHDEHCDVCDFGPLPVNHVDANKDYVCDVCEAKLRPDYDVNRYLETNEWGDDLLMMLSYITGAENAQKVPSIDCLFGYYVYFEEIPDGVGNVVTTVVVDVLGVNSETVIDEYETILVNNNYFLGSNPYGYTFINPTTDLVVQYELIEADSFFVLDLLIYVIETRTTEWPTLEMNTYLGFDVPHFECEAYDFPYFDPYSLKMDIYAHNVGTEGIVNYHNQIMETGLYDLTSNTADGYIYTSKDKRIYLEVYPIYDEYNRESLLIRATSLWPYFPIVAMVGEDIPCYSMNNFEWQYMDLDGDGTAEYLCLFFDGTSLSNYQTYCSTFASEGYSLISEESTDTNKYYSKLINGTVVVIQIVYSTTQNSICVAIK